ncbi:MAG: beta-propeller fold lactonase family protein [Gammaproteobacteria bacterium]|nr:beta-propeller fold lactonase family protein [Gammaproteobacteria bacterium]
MKLNAFFVCGNITIITRSIVTRSVTSGSFHFPLIFTVVLLLILVQTSVVFAHSTSPPAASSFTLFESGQVRPLALSPNGKQLYVVNTPDSRLEIFRVSRKGLTPIASVPVGLEPVAVAAPNNDEVWVVNHLSDSISIVDVDHDHDEYRVVRTLLVGDEPRDIVFAGKKKKHRRAFITTAHRGQHAPFDPQLTTPGIGRADVWVFDTEKLGRKAGGTPLNIITLFTDTPRALAVSNNGERVYAAGFFTGNRTTTIPESVVSANGGLPAPLVNFKGNTQPLNGLIVKYNGTHWLDELGRQWDDQVRFSLPDNDVFVIDAMKNPPELVKTRSAYSGVGTVIYNMAVNPANGHVYVTNTEALNENRFEGEGIFAGQTVRGHLHESRITILDQSGGVTPRHLNKHIDYSTCCAPIPNDENQRSLAFPMDMAFTRDGRWLYVTAFGSSKIGVFSTAQLEDDSFIPDSANHISVSGGGPSGIVLDEARGRMYVLTRFNNAISIIDLEQRSEISTVAMYNPEPQSIVQGRRFLYDAAFTSSHGDTACASCHVFGDLDSLAWDLGDPDISLLNNPGPFILMPDQVGSGISEHFLPLKGPMTTQSLRGLANHGAMHWRGDRTGGNDTSNAQPDSGAFDEDAAFKKFNVAFVGLNGRHDELTADEIQAFSDFVLQITYPPNPIRNLDNSLTPDQQAGHDFYFGDRSDTFFNCNGCHVLNPAGNSEFGVAKPGFFGTDGRYSFENETQVFKVPHLRNLYQKVGMFGMPDADFFLPGSLFGLDGFMGDQVRGFGFLHDGSTDTLFRFFTATVFAPRLPGTAFSGDPGNSGFMLGLQGIIQRRQVEQFMLAFDSNLAPIVGQQITLTKKYRRNARARINLLIARAEQGECDLIVTSYDKGYLYSGQGMFQTNRANQRAISNATLRKLATKKHHEITYTCTPPGSGVRMAIDRDEDGFLDGDEIASGSNPADPNSVPESLGDTKG